MWTVRTRTDSELADLFNFYIARKKDSDRANEELERAEKMLIAAMEDKQVKTVALGRGDHMHTGTWTQRNSYKINEQGLRRALRAKVYDRYTVRKLDRSKLEQAMSNGDVDPVVVARFVEQVPGKSYLTYRVKDDDESSSL